MPMGLEGVLDVQFSECMRVPLCMLLGWQTFLHQFSVVPYGFLDFFHSWKPFEMWAPTFVIK